jgi:hypothetical protein
MENQQSSINSDQDQAAHSLYEQAILQYNKDTVRPSPTPPVSSESTILDNLEQVLPGVSSVLESLEQSGIDLQNLPMTGLDSESTSM